MRATVLIDADSGSSLCSAWHIPSEQIVGRPLLTEAVRGQYDAEAWSQGKRGDFAGAERIWLFLPFEYDMAAAEVYDELVAFAERNIRRAQTRVTRRYWKARREYLLDPRLRFEVRPPSRTPAMKNVSGNASCAAAR